jgi:methyl-accepting chemotaxis protein
MKKRVAEFSAKVDKADIAEVTKAELKQKLADYQRDFFAWFGSAQKLAVELKATSDSFSEIEPVIAAVTKAVSEMRADADQANMRMRDIADWQMKLAIVVIAFSVLGISVFIGRSVSRQLSAMTGALGELAGGNFKIVLPGLGRPTRSARWPAQLKCSGALWLKPTDCARSNLKRSSGRRRSARPT